MKTAPLFDPHLDRAPSCDSAVHYVKWAELPLSCPQPDGATWNAHPRVYLAIHRTGRVQCGYCGTVYILEDPPLDAPDPVFANTEIEKEYRRAQARVRAGKAGD